MHYDGYNHGSITDEYAKYHYGLSFAMKPYGEAELGLGLGLGPKHLAPAPLESLSPETIQLLASKSRWKVTSTLLWKVQSKALRFSTTIITMRRPITGSLTCHAIPIYLASMVITMEAEAAVPSGAASGVGPIRNPNPRDGTNRSIRSRWWKLRDLAVRPAV